MNQMLTQFDVIARGARVRGMSDDQRNAEWALQKKMAAAVEEMRATIEAINEASVIAHISMSAFEAFCHDEMPDEANWDEKISIARQA